MLSENSSHDFHNPSDLDRHQDFNLLVHREALLISAFFEILSPILHSY
jgi:hypothetical protein